MDNRIRRAWKAALRLLEANGCTIVPISLPNTKHALSAYYVLAPAEAASNLSKYDGVRYGSRSEAADGAGDVLYSRTRGEGFGDEVKRRILLGSYTLSSEAINNYFIKAQKIRRLVQQDFDHVFTTPNPLRPHKQFDLSDMDESIQLSNKLGPPQVDFIVCPTAPTPPPDLHHVAVQEPVDTYMNDVFTVPASLAGLPAISIPFPVPVIDTGEENQVTYHASIQIIGQYADDFRLLHLAERFEKLRGHLAPLTSVDVQGDEKVKADRMKGKVNAPFRKSEIRKPYSNVPLELHMLQSSNSRTKSTAKRSSKTAPANKSLVRRVDADLKLEIHKFISEKGPLNVHVPPVQSKTISVDNSTIRKVETIVKLEPRITYFASDKGARSLVKKPKVDRQVKPEQDIQEELHHALESWEALSSPTK